MPDSALVDVTDSPPKSGVDATAARTRITLSTHISRCCRSVNLYVWPRMRMTPLLNNQHTSFRSIHSIPIIGSDTQSETRPSNSNLLSPIEADTRATPRMDIPEPLAAFTRRLVGRSWSALTNHPGKMECSQPESINTDTQRPLTYIRRYALFPIPGRSVAARARVVPSGLGLGACASPRPGFDLNWGQFHLKCPGSLQL